MADDVFSPLRDGVNERAAPGRRLLRRRGALRRRCRPRTRSSKRAIGHLRQQQAEHPFEAEQLRDLLALQNLPFLRLTSRRSAPRPTAIDVSNFDADITIDKGATRTVSPTGCRWSARAAWSARCPGEPPLVHRAADHRPPVQSGRDDRHRGSARQRAPLRWWRARVRAHRCLALFVAESTTLHKGQVLYTNGLQGAAFPSGIPVGRVTSFRTTAGGTQLTVQAEPAADLTNLPTSTWCSGSRLREPRGGRPGAGGDRGVPPGPVDARPRPAGRRSPSRS